MCNGKAIAAQASKHQSVKGWSGLVQPKLIRNHRTCVLQQLLNCSQIWSTITAINEQAFFALPGSFDAFVAFHGSFAAAAATML